MEHLVSVCLLLILLAIASQRWVIMPGFHSILLRGPPRDDFLFGVMRLMRLSTHPNVLFENWANRYGSTYRIPLLLGSHAIVVSDMKAVTHIFSKDTYTYVRSPGFRAVIDQVIGRGLLWVEGDIHRRQRRTMNPAFSPTVIKRMTPAFYDATYKLKNVWDKMLDSNAPNAAVEVEMHEWHDNEASVRLALFPGITVKGKLIHHSYVLRLDTIGTTVFGYHFNSLEGKKSAVEESLRIYNTTIPTTLGKLALSLYMFLPWVGKLPTKRKQLNTNLSESAREMLESIMVNQNQDQARDSQILDESIVELFVKEAEDDGVDLQSPEGKEEVLAKMKNLLIAGSDAPGIILVWALIELARHPEIQKRVREEVMATPGAELEWRILQSSCPFLDSVLSETLRLHPTVGETHRMANEDDVLHLKEPILDSSGQLVDCIHIPKGTSIIIPNHYLNSSTSIWGPDGLNFNPERWMGTYLSRSGDEPNDAISERRRLWTFGDGPRICVGKAFVMVQLKIVLAVLLRHFVFELPQGPNTPLDFHLSLVRRPKVKGMKGAAMPFLISRVD
ncbi:Cytochrome P450 monooxygenase 197 [Psilocybe cubensis]|uniref:Cytochrome P450 monooxygenase 197 n=1 Tax=Psilocybe cubensis TaxID=181762 RepID=A0ACB8H5Q7_PSICU|nr:Cytochrome P450 monooxygenase 197 [Psilocybe cubensis]KAH9483263.1 Cytochrome P450 monooxygenase 197 [Psilocybe cubensis]